MQIGDLLLPKPPHRLSGQLHLPFWGNSAALIVGEDWCEDCDFGEQTPLEERQRWIILESGELLFMTPFLVEQLYERW